MTITTRRRPGRARTRTLLRCGKIAGPLFIGTFLVEGLTRPSYTPSRHPVSSLALGPHGWIQTANFTTAGLLYLAFSAGLRRAPRDAVATDAGPTLIGAAALGLIGAAVFVTDPVSGYPPGTPDAAAAYTSAGALHDLFSVPTFLGIPAASLAFARGSWRTGDRTWATYSAASGFTMLALVAFASAGFNQVPHLVDVGGLLQRASVGTGFGWLTALALRTSRRL